MIKINGCEKEYTLDLNKTNECHNELKVESAYGWMVYMISAKDVYAGHHGPSTLYIDVNLVKQKDDFYIYLIDTNKDMFKIKVLHNEEMSREKNYIFKLGKYTIDNDTISFNVTSKENGKNEPWSIVFDGYPLEYEIVKQKTKATVKLKSKILIDYIGKLIIKQDNSGKELPIKMYHKTDGTTEKIEAG